MWDVILSAISGIFILVLLTIAIHFLTKDADDEEDCNNEY